MDERQMKMLEMKKRQEAESLKKMEEIQKVIQKKKEAQGKNIQRAKGAGGAFKVIAIIGGLAILAYVVFKFIIK